MSVYFAKNVLIGSNSDNHIGQRDGPIERLSRTVLQAKKYVQASNLDDYCIILDDYDSVIAQFVVPLQPKIEIES